MFHRDLSVGWLQVLKELLPFVHIIVGFVVAYCAYRLGLKAYFRQKEFENVRTRYLEQGIELICSQIDYALGVYRHNWMLYLRILKQYRDVEKHLSVEDFSSQFVELDQAYFQVTPMHKVNVLLKEEVVWAAYQKVFSFVGTTNDKIRAGFAPGLQEMLSQPNHPSKSEFVDHAFELAEGWDQESRKFYVLLSCFQEIAELLEHENLTRREVLSFWERKEPKSVIRRLREAFPSEEDGNGTARADGIQAGDVG